MLLAATTLTVAAGAAHAQAPPSGPPAQTAPQTSAQAQAKADTPLDSTSVETVTVTARKREERLIDVPVAANVLPREVIERYAITDLKRIQTIAPGLEIERTGGGTPGSTIRIRGIGVFGADYASEQPVSLVIDGVPVSRGHVIDAGFFDQANIQVLKGPQALFFGKNSPAGVVALDSVSPGRRFEGYGRVSYGFYQEDPTVEGAVSIPLGDKLSVRLAGRFEDMQGGYITNTAKPLAVDPIPDPIFGGKPTPLPGAAFDKYPQTKEQIGRLTVVWKPVENFDANFKFLGSHYHITGSYGNEALVSCTGANPIYHSALTGANYTDTGYTCGYQRNTNDALPAAPILDNYYGRPADGKYFTDTINYLAGLTLTYRMPWITFTSVSGYYSVDSREFDNYDQTIFAETPGAQEEKTKTFTQEVRAATDFNFPINFTVGAFYEHENRQLFTTNRIFLLPLFPAGIPGQEAFAGISNSMINLDNNKSENYSFFFQGTWKITDSIELAGGGRYTSAHKSAVLDQLMQYLDTFYLKVPGGPALNSSLTPAGTIYRISTSYEDFSPEVTLSWHPTKNILIYGAYKTGFLAGGIGNPGVVSNYTQYSQQRLTDTLTFAPERAEGEEIGIKGTLFDRRLTGDLTFFYYNYLGLQIATFHPENATFTIGNAASAVDKGVELNTSFRVTSQLSTRLAVDYVSLKYDQYTNAPCYPGQVAGCGATGTQNLSGKRFGSPPLTVTGGFTYERTFGQFDVTFSADAQHYTRSPALNGQPFAYNPAHTVVNAQVRLAPVRGPWSVALIGTNLNDALYFNSIGGKPLGAPGDLAGTVNEGREIRLQADYRF